MIDVTDTDYLEQFHQKGFQILGRDTCRSLLLVWMVLLGETKHRPAPKPEWWPQSIEYKRPHHLLSKGLYVSLNLVDTADANKT